MPWSPVCAIRLASFKIDSVDDKSLSEWSSKSVRVRRGVWSVGWKVPDRKCGLAAEGGKEDGVGDSFVDMMLSMVKGR